jgi:MtN3 and saliva related transmembrane protein
MGASASVRPALKGGTLEGTVNVIDWSDWIGYSAAVLTTASFVPQAWLTLRTRDVSGISAGMYAAFTAGVALWLVYGLLLGEWPIIVANAVTVGLAATILVVKLRTEALRRRALSPTQHPGLSERAADGEVGR